MSESGFSGWEDKQDNKGSVQQSLNPVNPDLDNYVLG